MKRFDIQDIASGVITHSYVSDREMSHQPGWGSLEWIESIPVLDELGYPILDSDGRAQFNQVVHPQSYMVIVTDITHECDLAECYRKRVAEYPPIGDQLDAIYKRDHLGDASQWESICSQIAAVKAKYPKPTV